MGCKGISGRDNRGNRVYKVYRVCRVYRVYRIYRLYRVYMVNYIFVPVDRTSFARMSRISISRYILRLVSSLLTRTAYLPNQAMKSGLNTCL